MTINVKKILESRKIPTLPAVAVKLLNLISDENADRQEIADTIKLDPGIASRVLQACNSNYYGLRANVRSVDHAVLLLGPGTLASLCLTFSLSSSSFSGTAAGDFVSVWEQSILRAVAAETLGNKLGHKDASSFFSKAILCDIGRLAILATEPKAYHEVFEKEREGVECIIDCENELLGTDHVQIGYSLALQWKLPPDFASGIQNHHSDSEELAQLSTDSQFQTLCVLATATLLSDFILYGQNACHYDKMIEIARDQLEMEPDDISDTVSEVRQRADELPQELNISSDSMPSADELRDCASDLLAAIAINTDATLESMTTEQRLLEMKNSSLKKACEKLEKQANVDFLTQLYNRNFFDLYLSEQLSRLDKEHASIGVILCDIDKFKSINDRWGHQAGDAILKGVARRLTDAIGEAGVVARYGGEEFIVAIVGSTQGRVHDFSEAIRASIESAPFDGAGKMIAATLSLGYVTTESDQFKPPFTLQSLVAAADAALYEAKNGGRNRVIAWRPELQQSNGCPLITDAATTVTPTVPTLG